MDGKLRRHQDKGILAKGRSRIFTSKVGDEELDQISRVGALLLSLAILAW